MKRNEFIINSYNIESDKNIAICSDIHINKNTRKKELNDILETLDEINPTHIVIPGDLYDVSNPSLLDIQSSVLYFVNNASSIAPTFYVQGNVEQRMTDGIREYKIDYLPEKLVFNSNPNFHLLCEKNIEGIINYYYSDGINIAGIKLPVEFYNLSELERTNFLLTQYKDYLINLSSKIGNKNFNLLLCHDPIICDTIKNFPNLNFDLIVSGHNHGGLWPKAMRPVFKFMGTNMDLCYPKYTRGMIDIIPNKKRMIVSEGITRFHSDFGSLQLLEKVHTGTIENVKILKR